MWPAAVPLTSRAGVAPLLRPQTRSTRGDRYRDLARPALPAGRHLRRHRHQLLAVLRGGRGRRAVPVRRRGRRAARRAQRGRRLLLARLPAARRAPGSATASGCTGRGTRPAASAATPASCCSTRTPRRSTAAWTGIPPASPTTSRPGDPASRNDQDSAPHVPKARGRQPVLRLGRRPPARHTAARVGDLRAARQGVHGQPPGHPRAAARHLRRPRPPGRRRLPARPSASPPSSCCRSTSSSTTPGWSSGACATTGATTPSGSSPPTTSTPAPAATAPRSPSSRRWCGRSTRPASR